MIGDALSLAGKELTTTFRSPIAAVFVGVFLIVVNLGFFTLSGFFGRGLADVRPLFEWLPLLLLVLVSALTMRAWAEEAKMGTVEVLLTLPVRPWSLVLGKFMSTMALVALALALTWPLPVLVSLVGPLDWGPVVSGYVGALLLGASYTALGLFMSSTTDNQVVALILTLVWGAFLVLTGHEVMTVLVSPDMGELLRQFSTGSRFESVERGVIDVSDLAYYGGLTASLLGMNTLLLAIRRIDAAAEPRRIARHALQAGLIVVNAVLLVVWTSALPGLRADLTADGLYSVSSVTRATLTELDEPLYIDAYLSSRTHPYLAPLVPLVTDTLAELEQAAGGRLKLHIADPAEDDELAAVIGEVYGIESAPFGVSDRNSQSVVNAYFHLLIRYGDGHRVLQLEDLIEYDADVSGSDVDVRLGDLEYILTRSVRKLTQDFQSLDTLIARLPSDSRLVLYTTPDTTPNGFAESVVHLRSVAKAMVDRSDGTFSFEEITPTPSQAESIAARHGVQPLAADLFGREVFYAHLVVETGDRVQRIMPGLNASEGDVSRSLLAAVRRASPGQLKRVGLVTETPEAPPPDPRVPESLQQRPPPADYRALSQLLGATYDVQTLDLSDGDVPDHMDALIVAKTESMDPKTQWAVDQYLMRGGAVLVMGGAFQVQPVEEGGLEATESDAGLIDLLAAWGVTVEPALVLDPQNAPFPIPVREQRGAYTLERIELLPYPFFPDVRSDGFNTEHAAVAGLTNVTVPWASPVSAASDLAPEVRVETVLSSSPGAWTQADAAIQPDMAQFPDSGFAVPEPTDLGRKPLAVTLTGPMRSYFAQRPSPIYGAPEGDISGADPTGRTLRTAAPEARLAVVGSSELASDVLVRLAEGPTGERHRSNVQAVQNLIDWSVEDTDLLAIRSASAFARTLPKQDPSRQQLLELGAYAGGLIPLGFISLIPLFWRRRLPARLAALDAAKELS